MPTAFFPPVRGPFLEVQRGLASPFQVILPNFFFISGWDLFCCYRHVFNGVNFCKAADLEADIQPDFLFTIWTLHNRGLHFREFFSQCYCKLLFCWGIPHKRICTIPESSVSVFA